MLVKSFLVTTLIYMLCISRNRITTITSATAVCMCVFVSCKLCVKLCVNCMSFWVHHMLAWTIYVYCVLQNVKRVNLLCALCSSVVKVGFEGENIVLNWELWHHIELDYKVIKVEIICVRELGSKTVIINSISNKLHPNTQHNSPVVLMTGSSCCFFCL